MESLQESALTKQGYQCTDHVSLPTRFGTDPDSCCHCAAPVGGKKPPQRIRLIFFVPQHDRNVLRDDGCDDHRVNAATDQPVQTVILAWVGDFGDHHATLVCC